jgi:cupin 2 domain-containing protein
VKPAGNLLEDLPADAGRESTETLVSSPAMRIERIVSRGQTSPEGFWYDQDEDEWVVVLRGRAKLRFEGENEVVEMGPGAYVLIAAHRRHRVEWTDPGEVTVWLAVFFRAVDGS